MVELICSVKFIVSLPFTFHDGLYGAMVKIESSGLLIAPVLLTVIIYVILLCTLSPQRASSGATSIRMRALIRMTHGVVIGLLVFNVPGLLYTLIVMIAYGYDMKSNIAVCIISRVLILNYKCFQLDVNVDRKTTVIVA